MEQQSPERQARQTVSEQTTHSPAAEEAIADGRLRELVRELVREELTRLATTLAESSNGSKSSPELAALAALIPPLQQTLLDAIRLGMSLQGDAGPTAESSSGGEGATAPSAWTPRPAGARPAPGPESTSRPTPPRTSTSLEAEEPDAQNTGAGGTAPWLVNGQITLIASPFGGFAEVQRFLQDLGRVARVYEVRPKRFSSGRLYATLATEYSDAQTLADILETELAPYRPKRRSVQTDLVELVLRPSSSSAEAV